MRMTEASISRVLTTIGKADKAVENAIIEAYGETGEYVVNAIRSGEMSNWNNDTGNLRSSVGCVVCRKGRIIRKSGFDTMLNGAEGSQKGIALAEKLAVEYARYDFALLIVAGEEYAVYVEAVENRVVLAGGQLYVEKNIIKRLQEKINQALGRI